MPDAIHVAIVGLGNMGAPIARRLIAAGHRVTGSDLAPTARAQFADAGGTPFETATMAAQGADVVILLLPDSNIVDAVLDDLLASAALSPSTVVIDMSSSEPSHSKANSTRLYEEGVKFIDAPVSGGVRGAAAGTLTVMVGGEAELVEHLRPLLEHLGSVRHVGPVGAGHAIKALNNLVSATHLWITSEAVFIAERFGITAQTVLDVLNGSSGRSGSSQAKWPDFIMTGGYDSGFAARLMLKDTLIATGVAAGVGLPSAVGAEVVARWSDAVDDLGPAADHTEIARWLSDRAEASR